MPGPVSRLTLHLLLLIPAIAAAQDYVLLGAGLRSRPAYDGSESQRMDIIPIIRYFGPTLFARTTQDILEGGARLRLAPGWDAGVQLAYEPGRRKSESSRLRELDVPDLDWSASLGLHLEGDLHVGPMPLNVLARTRHDVDRDRGYQVDLRSTAGVYAGGRLRAGVFAQLTWASSKYLAEFYGGGDSGPLNFGAGPLAVYELQRHWLVYGALELRRLLGDAARSPIAETRDNYYASASLAYRF